MKSLSGNSTSRIWVKIWNQQRCHTGQYRVGYLIQLGDPYPLSCIPKFACSDAK